MGIETTQAKLEQQEENIAKLRTDAEALKSFTETEKQKTKKLETIAGEKYQMDLANIDNYLPRSAAYHDKVAGMEKKLINEAKKQRNEVRG